MLNSFRITCVAVACICNSIGIIKVANKQSKPKYGIVLVGKGTFSELNQDANLIQKFLANK